MDNDKIKDPNEARQQLFEQMMKEVNSKNDPSQEVLLTEVVSGPVPPIKNKFKPN